MNHLARIAAVASAATLLSLVGLVRPAAAETWPVQVIDRPLTLPGGSLQAGVAVSARPGLDDDTPDTILFDQWGLDALVGYAFSDDVEVIATYAMTLRDAEAKGPLRVGVGVAIARGASGGVLDAALRLDAGYDFLLEQALPVTFGPQLRYRLGASLALVSPGQLGNWLSVAVDGEEDETGYTPRPITIDLPVGVLYQATPQLFAQLDTLLTSLEVKDSDTTYIGVDYVVARAAIGYTVSPALDVGALLAADVLELGDTFTAGAFLRWYGI